MSRIVGLRSGTMSAFAAVMLLLASCDTDSPPAPPPSIAALDAAVIEASRTGAEVRLGDHTDFDWTTMQISNRSSGAQLSFYNGSQRVAMRGFAQADLQCFGANAKLGRQDAVFRVLERIEDDGRPYRRAIPTDERFRCADV